MGNGQKDALRLCGVKRRKKRFVQHKFRSAKGRMGDLHSAKIQPVVGSVNAQRMRDIAKAAEVTITRREWYDLYCAAGKSLP